MSRKTVCQADGSDGKYVTQLWEYNKNGDVTKMSSDDETVIYQYDSKGKLLIISLTDDTGTEKIKFDYSKSDGNDIGFGKDSDGNTIKLEYNRKNKLISKRIFNDKREEVYSETREYYIDGTLSKIIAEDKNFLIKRKNITEYDRAGNISKEERYDISTDGEETLFYSVEYKHGTTVKQYHVLPDGYSVTEYSENGEEKMTVYDEDDNVVDCSRSIIEEKTEEYIKFAYYDENNNAEGYRIVYYGKEQKASKIENYDADGNLEGYSEQEHDKQGHILFFKNYDKNGKMIYSEEEVWSKK